MFVKMQGIIKEDFTRYIYHVEAVRQDEQRPATRMRQERRQIPMAQQTAAPPPAAEGAQGPAEPDEEGDLHIEQAVSDKIPRKRRPVHAAQARNTNNATAAPEPPPSRVDWEVVGATTRDLQTVLIRPRAVSPPPP